MPDTFAVYLPERTRHPFRSRAISYADDPATLAELADRVGKLKAAQAEIDTYIERMRDLFVASGQSEAEGALFRVGLGEACMSSRIDRKAVERDMGDSWLAKYLKWSPRKAAFTCTARRAP